MPEQAPEPLRGPAGAAGPARRSVLAGLLLAGTGLAGAGLAGCAGIPTSGPLQTDTDVALEPPGRPLARPPRPGARPAEVVDGFLRAAAIGNDEFAAARAHLADPNADWVPDSQVVLYTTPRIVVLSGPEASDDRPPGRGGRTSSPSTTAPPDPLAKDARASVVVRLLGVVASLDRHGILVPAAPGEQQERSFGLVARDGEWRIDTFDPGLVLTLGQFAVFSPYLATAVYFPEPTGRWLLPDIRYVRHQARSTATQVVTALLEGPADWLVPAVTEPAPGKRPALKVSSVPVVAGVAKVELAESALSLDQASQTLLRLQIRESLREATAGSLSSVGDVEVTVDGQPLQGAAGPTSAGGLPGAPGGAAAPRPAAFAFAGTTVVGTDAKARVVVGQPGAVRPVAGLQLAGGTRPAMSYATDARRSFALVVTGKDPAVRTLKTADGTTAPLDVVSAPDLVTPSFDSDGWVWTAPRRPAGRLVAAIVPVDRVRTVEVPVPWLTSGEVVALRLSREGARLLLAVDDVAADGRRSTRVLLAAVRRTATGEPVEVGPPVQLLRDVVRASDVGWFDDRTVVVLGSRRRPDRRLGVQPWVVDIGGDPTTQGIRPTADLGLIVTGADGKPLTTPEAWERLVPDLAPTLAVGDGLEAVYVATAKGDLYRYRQTTWERQPGAVFRPAFPG